MLSGLNRDLVTLPAPAWFPLVLLFLPGLFAISLMVARVAVRGRAMAWAIAPAVALSLWLALLQTGSLALHRFYPVAAAAIVLPGIAGYSLLAATRGRLRVTAPRGARALWLTVGALVVAALPMFWFNEAYDRDGFGGHYAFIAQILNDILPPREPTFTDNPLHYHLAIDYVVAFWVAATRLPSDRVFDAVVTVQWAYLGVMGAAVARAAFGIRRLWLAAAVTCLAGGIPWATGLQSDLRADYRDLGLSQDMLTLGPLPVIPQHVLQPPWLMGTPVVFAFAILLARGHWRERGPRAVATVATSVVLVVGLAMSQTAYLAVVTAALVLFGALVLARPLLRTALTILRSGHLALSKGFHRGTARQVAALLLGLAVATAIGAGLVQSTGSTDALAPSPFTLTDMGLSAQFASHGMPATRRWSAFVMVTTFVLLVPLAAWALWRRRRALTAPAAVLAVGAVIGMVLMNLIQHRYSWDMLKFGAVAMFFLAPMTAVAVDDAWGDGRSWRRTVAAGALAVATCVAGVVFLAGFWTPVLDGTAPTLRPGTYTPAADPDEIRALSYVRTHVTAGEVTVCEADRTDVCGELAGLPQLPFTGITNQVYSQKDRRRIEPLVLNHDHDFREYLDANVRWAILRTQGSGWEALLVHARQRRAIAQVVQFGAWQVVHFTPAHAFSNAPFPATGN